MPVTLSDQSVEILRDAAANEYRKGRMDAFRERREADIEESMKKLYWLLTASTGCMSSEHWDVLIALQRHYIVEEEIKRIAEL